MKIIGVTNRKLCIDFYKRIEEISKLDLEYLILREKDLGSDELLEVAQRVKILLKDSKIKLIINSNESVAKEIKAYGSQLSFNYFIAKNRNDMYGIVGVSVHSLSEGVRAYELGADYLLYGHVFETKCKEGLKPRGLNELEEICKSVKIPVYAIGGIKKENYEDVIKVGAEGIAIMSSLMS